MPKRLFDTEIWKKPWFRELNPKYKSAFYYILSDCDYVGVWERDFTVADFRIGSKINWDDFLKKTNGNIVVLPNGKWFIVDYCYFQYGDLKNKKKSTLKTNIISRLIKHDLWDLQNECIKEGVYPSPTLALGYKEKEKEKKKEKDKEKEEEKEKEYAPTVSMKKSEYEELCTKFGKRKIDTYIEKISDWQLSNGKRKKSMPATIKNWMRRDAGVESVKDLEIKIPDKCPKCGKTLDNEIRNDASSCYSCGHTLKNKGSP